MGSAPGPGRRHQREDEDGGGEPRWQRGGDRTKLSFYSTAAGLNSGSSDGASVTATGVGGRRGGGGAGRGGGTSRATRYAAAAGVGSRFGAAPIGKYAGELDADALYRDEVDRQTLENMNEFEREAELARRYEELVRERQRAELLRRQDRGAGEERSSGRLGEALSDIRARRARQKQLQQRQNVWRAAASDEEEEEEEEGAEEDFASTTHAPAAATAADEESEEMSVSLSSSEEEGEAVFSRVSTDESTRLQGAASTPQASESLDMKAADAAAAGTRGEEGAEPASASDVVVATAAEDATATELAGDVLDAAVGGGIGAQPPQVLLDEATPVQQREEEVCGDDLFEEDRIDTDEQRKKELARRMLQRVSLDLLNAARLSIERLTLMLEHPQAEKFVCGCYVKVPQQQQRVAGSNTNSNLFLATAAATAPCWVCQIVGLKPCDPYPVRLPTAAAAANCCYRLVLRLAPKAPARFDREFALTDLVSTPVTPSEFEDWKNKLEEFDTVEDVSKRIRMKLQMLKEFTFTDEDVQTILSRKKEGSATAVVQTSGSLLKQLMFVKHQLDTLHYSLSNASTAASSRKDLKEKLQVLQEKKADLEAKLARSKAATGGQRELLHRLSVEARLARRREHAAPLLLTRSSQARRPSGSSSTGTFATRRLLQQSLQISAAAPGESPGDSTKAANPGATFSSFWGGRNCGLGSRPGAARGAEAHNSTSTPPDGLPAFAGEDERERRRSLPEKLAAATSAAARNFSDSRSPGAGVSNRPAGSMPGATALRVPHHDALPAAGGGGSWGDDESAAISGSAEELLLRGTRQQQREWVQMILQNQRAAGGFKIEKSIPPPASYAPIISLLPYSPPPAGRGLLISLEEYKQQVAQLANLQLAG